MKKDLRAISQTVQNSEASDRYGMTVGEMEYLIKMAAKSSCGAYDALLIAFNYGFYQGNHATINRNLKKIQCEPYERTVTEQVWDALDGMTQEQRDQFAECVNILVTEGREKADQYAHDTWGFPLPA